MNRKRYIPLLGLLSLLGFSSCSNDYLNENPEHLYTTDRLYTSLEGYENGLNGLYALIRQEREGMGYENGFGTKDLYNVLFTAATDNLATGNNRGPVHKLINSWGSDNHPSTKEFDKYFLWFYKTINAANAILDRVPQSDINWNDKNGISQYYRVTAEAKLFRAWGYRHLSYLWGGVPIVSSETTDSQIRTDFVREPVAKVRRFIIEDLKFSADHLPWAPYKPGAMTKGVAMTYLAELYLASNKPDSAYYWANKCIAEGPYAIQTSKQNSDKSAFIGMFQPANINSSNPEILWELKWARGIVGGGENIMRHETTLRYEQAKLDGSLKLKSTEERGGRGWSRIVILKDALLLYYASSKNADPSMQQIDERGNEFSVGQYFVLTEADKLVDDSGDVIMNNALKRPWAVGDTVWISGKASEVGNKKTSGGYDYNNLNASKPTSNSYPYSLKYAFCDVGYPMNTESHYPQIYLRLAETILLRAEASIRLGRLAEAVSDINILRNRANAKTISGNDLGASLAEQLDFILDERTRELLLEEHRRYTLLRMGGKDFMYRRIKEHNLIDGSNFALKDTIFPIPQSVIDANRTLKMPQNPGYPGADGSNPEL